MDISYDVDMVLLYMHYFYLISIFLFNELILNQMEFHSKLLLKIPDSSLLSIMIINILLPIMNLFRLIHSRHILCLRILLLVIINLMICRIVFFMGLNIDSFFSFLELVLLHILNDPFSWYFKMYQDKLMLQIQDLNQNQ